MNSEKNCQPKADNPCPRNSLSKVTLIMLDNISSNKYQLIVEYKLKYIFGMRHQKDTGPNCTGITDAVCMAID